MEKAPKGEIYLPHGIRLPATQLCWGLDKDLERTTSRKEKAAQIKALSPMLKRREKSGIN